MPAIFAGYLCRKWNLRNIKFIKGVTLRKLDVKVFSRLNLVNGDRGEIVKKSSWRHWCFDEDYKRDNPKNKLICKLPNNLAVKLFNTTCFNNPHTFRNKINR